MYRKEGLAEPRIRALPVDVLRADLLQIPNAQVRRVDGHLVLRHLDDALHALDAVHVAEHERPAHAHGAHAQREQLEYVRAVAHAAVGVHLDLLEDLGLLVVDLERDLEG